MRLIGLDRDSILVKVKNPKAPAATRVLDGSFWRWRASTIFSAIPPPAASAGICFLDQWTA